MRLRSVELLKEVRFFFNKTHVDKTRYAQTDVYMRLKKNTALYAVELLCNYTFMSSSNTPADA